MISAVLSKLLTGNTFGDNKHFDKAYIPLNFRAGLEKQDYKINENGVSCCPHNDSLLMRYEGPSKLRSGVTRYKFVCPKIKWIKNESTGKYQRHCTCNNPCTTSSCGRMVYIILKRTFVPILEIFVVLKNVITPTKSENTSLRSDSCRDYSTDNSYTFWQNQSSRIYSQLKTSYCLGLTNSIKSMAYLSVPKIESYPFFLFKTMPCTFLFLFWFKIANEHREFRNYLWKIFFQNNKNLFSRQNTSQHKFS